MTGWFSTTGASRGARACMPLNLSVAVYGMVFGVLAVKAGLSPGTVALMSGLVYAGASQFVALDLWSATPDSLAIIVAVGVINLRMILATATLGSMFAAVPRPMALASMAGVSDETWALTLSQKAGPSFLIGASVSMYLTWLLSTWAGALVGATVEFDPAAYGIDFVFTAVFLALLIGLWRGRGDLAPWAVAAAVGVLAYGVSGDKSLTVMTSGLSAAAAGFAIGDRPEASA